jgi:hypothetical protein
MRRPKEFVCSGNAVDLSSEAAEGQVEQATKFVPWRVMFVGPPCGTSRHPLGSCNSDVAPAFLENLCKGKVKVKFSLEQAMKAQRGSRSIALLFL